jgi:hypothetical protein
MSGKVISLAARRTRRLSVPTYGKRDAYDAWLEADGTLFLRFDATAITYVTEPAQWGPASGPPAFTARGNAYEIRIPTDIAAQWFHDMQDCHNTHRRVVFARCGFYLWRCKPNGDGTYTVEHEGRRAVFEPFKPRGRRELRPTGKLITDGFGHEFEERAHVVVAPDCAACGRVVQVGETAYRERRNPHGRNFGDAVICSDCVAKAPAEGLQEVSP